MRAMDICYGWLPYYRYIAYSRSESSSHSPYSSNSSYSHRYIAKPMVIKNVLFFIFDGSTFGVWPLSLLVVNDDDMAYDRACLPISNFFPSGNTNSGFSKFSTSVLVLRLSTMMMLTEHFEKLNYTRPPDPPVDDQLYVRLPYFADVVIGLLFPREKRTLNETYKNDPPYTSFNAYNG
ncbi:hypothetical protein SFRURICE_011367 [Spodoptera frugiperda]|nr:hypothetical protein SFRURICE_011367 [Spodoptera frugiperda]